MSRRYDSRTTTFSPEGRLFQVEYAMNGIEMAGATLGAQTTGGIVICAEKKTTSKLLDQTHEKVFVIDDHIFVAAAGLTSDSYTLIARLRLLAQRHFVTYGEPIPVEQLVTMLCEIKQGYTQIGGLRPFGVSFLFAGWDKHQGFQLYSTDPSANFAGWKATAIGAKASNAQTMLKTEWSADLDLPAGGELLVKTMARILDQTTPSLDMLELATLSLDSEGKPLFTRGIDRLNKAGIENALLDPKAMESP